ncbi:hypothetical protein D3C75_1180910 [compost metagenome]
MDHFQKMSAARLAGKQISVRNCCVPEDRLGNRPGLLIASDHVTRPVARTFHSSGSSCIQEVDSLLRKLPVTADGFFVLGISGLYNNISLG